MVVRPFSLSTIERGQVHIRIHWPAEETAAPPHDPSKADKHQRPIDGDNGVLHVDSRDGKDKWHIDQVDKLVKSQLGSVISWSSCLHSSLHNLGPKIIVAGRPFNAYSAIH